MSWLEGFKLREIGSMWDKWDGWKLHGLVFFFVWSKFTVIITFDYEVVVEWG